MKGFRVVLFVSVLLLSSCQKGQIFGGEHLFENLPGSIESVSETLSFPLCKEDALKIIEPISRQYPDRWVDISNDIIPAKAKIAYNTMGHQVDVDDLSYCQSPDYDSWLLVVDKDRSILGRQNMIHIFVDVKTGIYSTMELGGRAIVDWDTSRNIYIVSEEDGIKEKNIIRFPKRDSGPTSWAVIIGGGCNMTNNLRSYYLDCVNIYSKLTQELGYAKGNIFCLISDGTDPAVDQRATFSIYINSNPDLDGDGTNDIQYKASKSNIACVFDNLSDLVQPGDEILVFITDHGDEEGCIYLWDDETFWPSELNAELNKLGTSVLIDVVMGQSYSGAFISPLSASNRTIATACSATEGVMIKLFQYDYFLHYWTEHISYLSDNEDRYVRPSDLFQFANQNVTSSFYQQHPQFISTPSNFGWSHSIEGGLIPHISGSNYLSTNINSYYSIVNYPNTATVTWSVDHSAVLVSYTDSTAVVKGRITDPLQFCSTLARINASFIVNGRQHSISKNINAIWKPGYYNDGGHIWGSNGIYHVRYLGGEYGYEWYSTNPAWQITGYYASTASVLEGNTNESVSLISTFYDPFGEMIFVSEQVH